MERSDTHISTEMSSMIFKYLVSLPVFERSRVCPAMMYFLVEYKHNRKLLSTLCHEILPNQKSFAGTE